MHPYVRTALIVILSLWGLLYRGVDWRFCQVPPVGRFDHLAGHSCSAGGAAADAGADVVGVPARGSSHASTSRHAFPARRPDGHDALAVRWQCAPCGARGIRRPAVRWHAAAVGRPSEHDRVHPPCGHRCPCRRLGRGGLPLRAHRLDVGLLAGMAAAIPFANPRRYHRHAPES